MWPYLLGVRSPLGDQSNRRSSSYSNILKKWKRLEEQHYINNDPTSTSVDIRRGFTPLRSQATPTRSQTTPPSIPDMIILDDHSSCDGHVTTSSSSSEDELDSGCEDLVADPPRTSGSSDGGERRPRLLQSRDQSEEIMDHRSEGEELSKRERDFISELFKIDKDVPRCDRDYE